MLRAVRLLRRAVDTVAWTSLALLIPAIIFCDALTETFDRSTPSIAARESGVAPPTLSDAVLNELFSRDIGYTVLDHFLSPSEVLAARRDALALAWEHDSDEGRINDAGTHKNGTHR